MQYLKFNPEALNEKYTVTQSFNGELQAKYNVEIKFTRFKKSDAVIQINRSPVVINELTNELNYASELAAACGQILYPVELMISKEAIITDVSNHEEILNRWLRNASALRQYYIGDIADTYIAQTEQTIMHKERIVNAIKNDLFMNVYFTPLNYNLRDGLTETITTVYNMPIPVTMEIQQNANRIKDDDDMYSVDVTGCSTPQDFQPAVTLDGRYKVKKRIFHIESAGFNWRIHTADGIKTITLQIDPAVELNHVSL